MEQKRIYIAYAPADKPYLDKLSAHLNAMERQGLISAWTDEAILAGEDYVQATEQQIANAQIILLLISSDFLASDFCIDQLLNLIMQKHTEGTAMVIPIIVRYCDWYTMPFAMVKALPVQEGKVVPVKDWTDPDKAFYSISQELRKIIQPKTNTTQSYKAEPVFYNPSPTHSTPTPDNRSKLPFFIGGILLAVAFLVGFYLLQQMNPHTTQPVEMQQAETPPIDTANKNQIVETGKPDSITQPDKDPPLSNTNTNTKPPQNNKPGTSPGKTNPPASTTPANPSATHTNTASTSAVTTEPQTPKKVTIVLKVRSPLSRNRVWIDGKEYAASPLNATSIAVSNVPIGDHKVSITKDDSSKCTGTLNIQSNNQEFNNFSLCQ